MADEPLLSLRPPFDPTAPGPIRGMGHGLNVEPGSGNVFFWSGDDWWMAVGSDVFAPGRGLLHFVPSGQFLHGDGTETPPPFPAVGDSLVFEFWPTDYLDLVSLWPDRDYAPHRIVFQNVDRAATTDRVIDLVARSADSPHYQALFLEDGEESIPPDQLAVRVRRWIEAEWLHGRGVGVFVDPAEGPRAIGATALPPTAPPGGWPGHVRAEEPGPAGTTGLARLTLRVLSEHGRELSPCFAFRLLNGLPDASIEKHWSDADEWLGAMITAAEALPAVRCVIDDREVSGPPLTVSDDPPPALPDLRLEIRHEDSDYWVDGWFDPLDRPEQGYWRFQTMLPEGTYQDRFTAPQYVSALISPRTMPLANIRSDEFFREVRLHRWFGFPDAARGQHLHRFILGVNMETCRQKHFRDLSGSDLLYEYYASGTPDHEGGQLELKFLPSSSAPDSRKPWILRSGNNAELRRDMRAIREMGANTVRVWLSEYLEGIRFAFTTPSDAVTGRGSLLMNEREAADNGTSPDLHSFVFPVKDRPAGNYSTMHACSAPEFVRMVRRWATTSSGPVLEVAPPSNALFQRTLDSARAVMAAARAENLKVFWTLLTHFGEAKPKIGKWNAIYHTHPRSGRAKPPRLTGGSIPISDWLAYYSDPPDTSVAEGRLPVEAWIYRSLISTASFRQSYFDNFVRPFVRAMEQVPGEPVIGYEVINETDVLWDLNDHGWPQFMDGKDIDTGDSHHFREVVSSGTDMVWRPVAWNSSAPQYDLETGWRMTTADIRSFVAGCADAIRREIPRDRVRVITSGVLGQETRPVHGGESEDKVLDELVLLRPDPPLLSTVPEPRRSQLAGPPVNLSASGFTTYAFPRSMEGHPNPVPGGDPPVEFMWRPFGPVAGRSRPHGVHSLDELASEMGVMLFDTDGDGTRENNFFDGLLHNNRALIIEAGGPFWRNYNGSLQRETIGQILETCLDQGYAGVFIWHYHNPARGHNPVGFNLPLTENPDGTPSVEPNSFVLVPRSEPHKEIRGRHGVRAIQAFANRLGRLLRIP